MTEQQRLALIRDKPASCSCPWWYWLADAGRWVRYRRAARCPWHGPGGVDL